MHNHFDKNLNLKSWILSRGSRTIVECGAGTGELTRQLSTMITSGTDVYVISDKKIPGLDSRIHWKTGLSYNLLKDFPDNSIDLCVIDTDHNYWTLMTELEAVKPKIAEGGLIALHDVETFYYDTGMALSYSTGEAYPKELIESYAPRGSLGIALLQFLSENKWDFKLLAFTHESHGAALIEKKNVTHFSLIVPGGAPAYAEPK